MYLRGERMGELKKRMDKMKVVKRKGLWEGEKELCYGVEVSGGKRLGEYVVLKMKGMWG